MFFLARSRRSLERPFTSEILTYIIRTYSFCYNCYISGSRLVTFLFLLLFIFCYSRRFLWFFTSDFRRRTRCARGWRLGGGRRFCYHVNTRLVGWYFLYGFHQFGGPCDERRKFRDFNRRLDR